MQLGVVLFILAVIAGVTIVFTGLILLVAVVIEVSVSWSEGRRDRGHRSLGEVIGLWRRIVALLDWAEDLGYGWGSR